MCVWGEVEVGSIVQRVLDITILFYLVDKMRTRDIGIGVPF